jgi:hypothetical protein
MKQAIAYLIEKEIIFKDFIHKYGIPVISKNLKALKL